MLKTIVALPTNDQTTEGIPQGAQKVHPARPQRVRARGIPSGYVEGLNDARTLLVGFFSTLLGRA
jgi:hypothetical protein